MKICHVLLLLARLSSDVFPATCLMLVDVDEVVEAFPLLDVFLRLLPPLFPVMRLILDTAKVDAGSTPISAQSLMSSLFLLIFPENHKQQPENVIFLL